MRRSRVSGCVRKTWKREMETSIHGETDLKRRFFDLGLSVATEDMTSSSNTKACLMLGLAAVQ